MTRIVSYNVASIVLTATVLFAFCQNKKIPLYQSRVFLYLVIANLVSSVASTLLWVFCLPEYSVAVGYKILLEVFYFSSHPLCAALGYLYVMSLIRDRKELKSSQRISVILPLIVLWISVLITPFTNFLFYFDDEGQYQRSSGAILVYVITAYFFACLIIYLFRYRSHFSISVRIALLSLVALAGLATLIQYYLPSYPVENCAIALCLLMLLLTIQNPTTIIDSKTGMFNRGSFVSMMGVHFAARKKFSILNVVVNDFYMLDKSLGTVQAKCIVSEIHSYLSSLKHVSKVYSIGDGNFCVEIIYDNVSEIERCAEKLSDRFLQPWECQNYSIVLNARVCCINCPHDAMNREELMIIISWFETANVKQRLVLASTVDEKIMSRASDVKAALEGAVEHSCFEITYLPTFSFKTHSIVSAKASVRFFDEELGYVYPEEFIPIAEKNGYILKVGKITFESVCRFISENQLEKYGIEYIEVSLSIIQCMQHGLAEEYLEIMNKYGISTDKICFRISEDAASSSLDILNKYMSVLHNKGVCFCLDNYGIGYSNISFIYDLPFSMVKISKNVMKAAAENPKAAITLKSTLALVSELGMKTIVEGVENRHIFDKLFDMPCDYAQGYYFSSHLSENELIDYAINFSAPETVRNGGAEK